MPGGIEHIDSDLRMQAQMLLMECPEGMSDNDKVDMLMSYLGVTEQQARFILERWG